MSSFPGPDIFWTTLAAVVIILSLATLIGRAWSQMFPRRSADAQFYLAPALGLASLTIVASLVGRVLPLGNSIVVPLLVIGLLIFALGREENIREAFRHALLISSFGVVCGASVLAPLLVYGAINAHNDTFTYLAHAMWLQDHAFGNVILPDQVTPLTSQVSLYQHYALRMGGSFLLGLLQALLNLRWSYEVYPAVVVSTIAICCLAIGFPLAATLRPIRPVIRLALLALPGFSFGGLVFGANFGFLPQTVGVTLGASLLFTVGPTFCWVVTTKASRWLIGQAALPSAALFAGAVFAYSEIAPFLLVAVLCSGFVMAFRSRAWNNMLMHCGVFLGLSILLLNTELIRAYDAIRSQSAAVVGGPVDWTLLGYLAHAFAVHGGAWDLFQWTGQENVGSSFALGIILFSLVIAVLLAEVREIWRATTTGELMPTLAVLILFLCGIMYFRYFVPTPFPKGVGQSWSQFKLSDWAHPFVMAFVLLSLAKLRQQLGKLFDIAIVALFAVGLLSSTVIGVKRITPLICYYTGVNDLNSFYLKFRDTVLATCPATAPIYLALGGQHHKFREMAALYLYDRAVTSDWTDDSVIVNGLPFERRTQELTPPCCVVEPIGVDGLLSQATRVGPVRVGLLDGAIGKVRIGSVTGAYDRESDGENWWYWIEHKVSFKLEPLFVPKNAIQTRLRFEYGTRSKQVLNINIIWRNGSRQQITLKSGDVKMKLFEKVLDLPAIGLAEMNIETDGTSSSLGRGDARMAAFIIRNLRIIPVSH